MTHGAAANIAAATNRSVVESLLIVSFGAGKSGEAGGGGGAKTHSPSPAYLPYPAQYQSVITGSNVQSASVTKTASKNPSSASQNCASSRFGSGLKSAALPRN